MAKGIKYDFVITKDEAKREKYHHLILVEGTDFDVCRKKVLNFFQHYQLVRYFQTDILKNESLAASSPDFEDKLKKSIQKNREILNTVDLDIKSSGRTFPAEFLLIKLLRLQERLPEAEARLPAW